MVWLGPSHSRRVSTAALGVHGILQGTHICHRHTLLACVPARRDCRLQTGAVSRAIDRGTRGINFILRHAACLQCQLRAGAVSVAVLPQYFKDRLAVPWQCCFVATHLP